ncbi:MAG: Wzz/FepE/Etk N-terminal domain-containing protein, partial [Deltaproteobacteria bacterium]
MHKNISGYIEVFLRRKWAFISLAVAGAAIGGVIAYTLPAYYMSSTLIIIEEQQVPAAYVTPTDVTTVAQRINVIKQHILSRTKLEEIIKNFNLYTGSKAGSLPWPLSRIIPWGNDALAKDEAIDRMRKDIEFKVIGGDPSYSGGSQSQRRDAAFTISYIGRDPNTAMQVTNMLASLLIEENLQIREQYAEGTSEFLVSELEKSKKELSEQEAAIRRFKEARMGGLPEQLDANLRTLDRLQLELQSVSGTLKNAEDRKSLLEEQLGG